MFSATVPRAIEELAKAFQTDALRIATRGEARQHADIEYRALSVAPRDRENAIFNLLRFQDAPTAIVFCKTRANVSHLHARMGNRGFPWWRSPGELSQAERTHALQALRDGRARVCIATDVAARGIDLPGLDLVVHADLPTNSETLCTARGARAGRGQGRVGADRRAGRVPPARSGILQGAGVVPEWGPAALGPGGAATATTPASGSIPPRARAPARRRPLAASSSRASGRTGSPRPSCGSGARALRARGAVGGLRPAGPRGPGAAARARGLRGRGVVRPARGPLGRAEARWLLPKICEAGGVTKEAVGAIRVQADETFVQIAAGEAHRFDRGIEVVPGLVMRRLPGAPALERPEGPPRRPGPAPGRAGKGGKGAGPTRAPKR
jgi:ATP-dependent RNA helicase DeaD